MLNNEYKLSSFVKPVFCLLFVMISFLAFGQEICDNGIDDDGDALIDLNDDECDCPTTIPLDAVTGFICKNNLQLFVDEPSGISYQWYRDGVALSGETNTRIELRESPNVEGDYICRIVTASGCIQTIPFEVIVPEPKVTDLGIVLICPGECYIFGPFTLCDATSVQFGTTGANGCDSINFVEVRVITPAFENFKDTICTGQTYTFHGITANTAGVYRDTIQSANGCDSILTVNLSVLDVLIDTIRLDICEGDTLTILGNQYTSGGTYQAVDTTSSGCQIDVTVIITQLFNTFDTFDEFICAGDTVRFLDIIAYESGSYSTSIPNNAGCDSIITLSVTILEPTTFEFNDTICSGNTYQYFGITATEAGSYHDTIVNVQGCDSIITVNLSVFDEVEFTLNEEICQGEAYILNGTPYTSTGQFFETIVSPTGCDSLVTLNLLVKRPSGEVLNETICLGETYSLFDISESTAGTYKTTITNAVGCDSVITVNLTVQDPQDNMFNDTICAGATYILYDIETSDPGQYSTTIQTPEGCDSTLIVNLHVLAPIMNTVFDTICAGATYINGDIESQISGQFTSFLSTPEGCDSTLMVNLHVLDPITNIVFDTICSGATYINGDIESAVSGQFSTTITTSEGCDSILTIELFVEAPITNTIQAEICEGTVFTLNDIEASTAGTYVTTLATAEGCDSILTVELSLADPIVFEFDMNICEEESFQFNEHLITDSGIYESVLTTADGCDSTAILNMTVDPIKRATYDITICDGDVFYMGEISALTTGTYTSRKSNESGCDSIITVNLTVNSLGDHIDLGDDMELSLGYDLDVIPYYLYENLRDLEWFDNEDHLLGEDRELRNFAPEKDTQVFLEGIDDNGCPAMDSLMIRVNLDVVIGIPNIISANNDGSNDNFILKANNAVTSINKVLIYDRWGSLVHEGLPSEDVDHYILWDGMYNGSEAAQGVYAYFIQVGILDGSKREYYGDITLIK